MPDTDLGRWRRAGSAASREGYSAGLCSEGTKMICKRSPPAKHRQNIFLKNKFNLAEPDRPLPTAPTTTLESARTTTRWHCLARQQNIHRRS